jgi:hypothetical protein
VPLDDIEPLHDLDSTDQFEILTEVPESAYVDEAAANETFGAAVAGDLAASPADSAIASEEASEPLRPIVPALPEAVATAAAGLASAAAATAPLGDGATAGTKLPPARPAAPWRRVAEAAAEEAETDEHEHPQLAEDLAEAARARTRSWAWGLGAFLLALALSAQVVDHYRLQLARDASVGPALREAYARIGRPLPPASNLGAFELRQWGANEAAPTAAGSMTVRASLRNGATFAQPMPLLRLELEDRFGGTVARRDFTAREYLTNPAQANRLLAAGTATEAELAVVDAPADAVGYRLDVCLREADDGVRCAQDSAASSGPGPQ